MPNRVTNDEVDSIVDTKRDTTTFIETANLLVTEHLVGKGLTDKRLKLVELYLAAHFVTVTEEKGGLRTSTTSDAKDVYALQTGMGFSMTRYGQQAMAFDTSQILRSLDKQGPARFTVV